MSDLQIQLEDVPGLKQTALVILRGSIDAKTVFTFQSKLNSVMERGYRRFIIDMDLVKYVNSTGLGYLINLSDSIGAESGQVSLVKVQPKVKVVFDMLGLNEFFQVFATREDAVAHLNGVPVEQAPEPAAMPDTVVIKAPRPAPPAEETDMAVDADAPTPRPMQAVSPDAPTPRPSLSPLHRPATEIGSVPCGSCSVPLVIREPGAYRCPRCSAVFQFNGGGITQVAARRRGTPVQMSIDCGAASFEGLVGFVDALARRTGFADADRTRLCEAVRACVEDVKQYSYNGEEDKLIHVLMVGGEAQLEMRMADTGKSVQLASTGPDAEGPFKLARRTMDLFTLTHHPKGGNILTLVKRKP